MEELGANIAEFENDQNCSLSYSLQEMSREKRTAIHGIRILYVVNCSNLNL